jgi:Transposase IS116/IS110/IS902 family
VQSAWLFVLEFFAWRDLQTPQQVGARAGLTPTPSQSGQASRALGIAKAGKGSRRPLAVEIAWGGVRFHPQSPLTQWSQARFGSGSARLRKRGLVARVRQLLLALWRFLKPGVLPAGAVRKAEASGETSAAAQRWQGQGKPFWAGVGHALRGTGAHSAPLRRRGDLLWASPAPRAHAASGVRGEAARHGEQGVWGQCAPRSTTPPAQVARPRTCHVGNRNPRGLREKRLKSKKSVTTAAT